ncbi:LysR family transcriptional regulator [Streptomyces venezuelae]|uniref:LysR family transcriptional regulator n=1 Tax=Streptomyces venezuelae TaxID=54571 RepID=UPI0012387384|nr:LysR family transcriptional regulator [Streptomyces venezuelae]QES09016.1 LysR family transcriptional regulator [Streptomyces venezuelae]
MDPHLLRTYVTVARLASFSEAARALGYTQSAVSQHIAALEADLALPLLTRRPVAPTPAGERLLEHAGALLLRLDAARADLDRFAAAPRTTLSVAASPLALHPRTLAALPATGVTLRALPRERVPEAVATGDADAGLVDGIAAPSDPLRLPDVAPLTATPVAEEPLAVLLPAGHPLAGRPGLRLADLVDARWLDAPAAGVPLDELRSVHGGPAGRGFRTALRYEGTDTRALTALAAAGHGLALLPLPLAAGVPGAVGVPLVAPRLVHRTELLRPAGRVPAPTGPVARFTGRLGA